MKFSALAVFVALSFASSAGAQETDNTVAGPELATDYELVMEEATWEWRPGDLIFRNGVNEVDESVKRTLGLTWATVGILRPSSGGPRVIFVDQANGVTEDMLYAYVDGLSSDNYAVYRPTELDPEYDPETDVMAVGPLAKFALAISYGAPQDNQFLFGNAAFYGAELAYESALNAGIALGRPERLGRLLAGTDDLDPAFRKLLEAHRYCKYELSFDTCWPSQLVDLSLVTTDSLIASGGLERVYP